MMRVYREVVELLHAACERAREAIPGDAWERGLDARELADAGVPEARVYISVCEAAEEFVSRFDWIEAARGGAA